MSETALSLERAIELAATGDIWLFRGTSMADLTIRTATNSPVNHVGMAVAIDDLPPLLWHAELGRSLPDVWTGQRQRGVQLHLLADAVRTWTDRYGQQAWMRQLEGEVTREQEDRLMEIIERFDGKPFPTMVGMVGRRLTGRWRRSASIETIFCAELVATTYRHMGLLPGRRPPSAFDPGRFWSGHHLALTPPYRLAGEIPVAVPPANPASPLASRRPVARRGSWRRGPRR